MGQLRIQKSVCYCLDAFQKDSFKTDSIIARPVGGTAVDPVQLGDEDEAANPAWDLICSTRKEQRMVDKQVACHGGRNLLSVKRKTEIQEHLGRTKVKQEKQQEKQKNLKAIQKTMDTANLLQMAQLYQSLGVGKAREILASIQNAVTKVDIFAEEEAASTMTMSTTTTRSDESDKENRSSSPPELYYDSGLDLAVECNDDETKIIY